EREAYQAESADELENDDEELLRLVHLEQWAPERLEGPWPGEQADDEGCDSIAYAHALVEGQRHEVDGVKRQSFGEIKRRDPSGRVFPGGLTRHLGFLRNQIWHERLG